MISMVDYGFTIAEHVDRYILVDHGWLLAVYVNHGWLLVVYVNHSLIMVFTKNRLKYVGIPWLNIDFSFDYGWFLNIWWILTMVDHCLSIGWLLFLLCQPWISMHDYGWTCLTFDWHRFYCGWLLVQHGFYYVYQGWLGYRGRLIAYHGRFFVDMDDFWFTMVDFRLNMVDYWPWAEFWLLVVYGWLL